MLRQILLLTLFFPTYAGNILAQKNPLRIYGTVPVNDSTFMKKTEVTVKEWIEFIVNKDFDTTLFPRNDGVPETISLIFDDLKKIQKQKYFHLDRQSISQYDYYNLIIAKPTASLHSLFKNDTSYVTLDIPITGITFEQATKFCDWKEQILNTKKITKVKLSLPTVEIYRNVIPNKDSLNKKKCAQFNWVFCNCLTDLHKKNNKAQGKSLVRVDGYWPSDLGLYNLQGNASEMTSTKGIAMGGSFRHPARESYNDRTQEYGKPEDWLGFRYIVTLK